MELAIVKYIKEHGLAKAINDFSLKTRIYQDKILLKYSLIIGLLIGFGSCQKTEANRNCGTVIGVSTYTDTVPNSTYVITIESEYGTMFVYTTNIPQGSPQLAYHTVTCLCELDIVKGYWASSPPQEVDLTDNCGFEF